MRKIKKILGLALAVVTAQSTIYSGNIVMQAEELGLNVSVEAGVEDVMVNPLEKAPITAEAVTVPAITPITEDMEGNTVFTFTSEGIEVSEGATTGYEVTGTSLTITESGTYYVSGECTDGAITIAKKTKDVTLVLNGLQLSSQTTAPLVMNSKTEVNVVVYGENALSDTIMNNDEEYPDNGDAENAVMKAKSDSTLTISGGGRLSLQSNAKNALKSNGSLVIDDVVMDITSVDNGISNEDNVTINGGYLNIKSEGDGIKSGSDSEPVGSITVNGGTIVIDAMADGMQATKEVVINDGVVDIRTYGGAYATYDGDDDAYPSAKGVKASGSYEVVIDEETEETKEVDATGCALTINGGTLYLDCADDAVHSDGDVTITGGYIDIATGSDAIQADYINTIGTVDGKDDDLYIYASTCVEAIEGAEVYMHSGTTRVFASDDGVNAANSDLGNYDFIIKVTGGNHYVSCSEGDGFDSNGSMVFEGGKTVVLGSSGAGEGDPLDCETGMTITGGKVLAIGTFSQMGAVPRNNNNYVQFGGNGGMNQNFPGGAMNPEMDRPQMPGVSGEAMRPEMPGVSGEAMRPEMPGVSGEAMNPEMDRPQMPGVSGEAMKPGMERPEMPGVSGEAFAPGMQKPGDMQSNISIKDGDTVVVSDASGNAIAATIAKWIPDASSYRASYVFCWSEEIARDADYILYVNGSEAANNQDEVVPGMPEIPESPEGNFLPGDVNKDGSVTLTDAQLALRMALLLDSVSEIKNTDMDNDGIVTLTDAQKILRRALLLD